MEKVEEFSWGEETYCLLLSLGTSCEFTPCLLAPENVDGNLMKDGLVLINAHVLLPSSLQELLVI